MQRESRRRKFAPGASHPHPQRVQKEQAHAHIGSSTREHSMHACHSLSRVFVGHCRIGHPFCGSGAVLYLCKRNRRLDSQTKINCTRRSHQPMIDCTPPTCAIVSCQCADLRTLIGLQWPSHHYYGALKCLVRAIWDTQFSVSCSSLIDVTERWIVCVEMYKPTSCVECV